MVYWHVEKKSVCIHSQLKSCSASEDAAMIERLMRHDTDPEIRRNSTPYSRSERQRAPPYSLRTDAATIHPDSVSSWLGPFN